MRKRLLKFIAFCLIIAGAYISYLLVPAPNKPLTNNQFPHLYIKTSGDKRLYKLLPIRLFVDYRYWSIFDPVTPPLINGLYDRYSFYVASKKPLERLIRSVIARNLYPSISKPVIFRYLEIGQYDANGIVANSTLPYLNFSLFGYSRRRPLQNTRVLEVARILVSKGADINGIDVNSGRTPLHEAILMNNIEVVKFLLKHRADPYLRVNQPKSKFHGMNSLQFSIFMEEAAPGESYTEIITTLTRHLLNR